MITQIESHADAQQDGSIAQTALQQLSSSQAPVECGE